MGLFTLLPKIGRSTLHFVNNDIWILVVFTFGLRLFIPRFVSFQTI